MELLIKEVASYAQTYAAMRLPSLHDVECFLRVKGVKEPYDMGVVFGKDAHIKSAVAFREWKMGW